MLMVHLKILVPEAKAVTVLTGESEFVMVPPPVNNDHVPTPLVKVFAARVVLGELMQSV